MAGGGREELAELATQEGVVDLIIPRGGEGLKAALSAVAKVPVIYAASGNCHVYVDESADLDSAREIVVNAKVQRPGVCNAAETLLVHSAVADAFLPAAFESLRDAGVELRGDERARAVDGAVRRGHRRGLGDRVPRAGARGAGGRLASTRRSSTSTRTAPATRRRSSPARRAPRGRSSARVDAACVYVNASTRFTDGGQFGMGAEIGNSTQKLHARGPIGLRELCTFKYLVEGDGQVRSRSAASGCSAGRSTRRTSAISSARRRRSRSSSSTASLLVPVHEPPHKGVEADPGVAAPRSSCAGARSWATSGSTCRSSTRRSPGPPTRSIPCEGCMSAARETT